MAQLYQRPAGIRRRPEPGQLHARVRRQRYPADAEQLGRLCSGRGALGHGSRRIVGVDRGAHQYAGQGIGGADAAVSDLDADDHEEHRLDFAAGPEIRDLERYAAAVFRHSDAGVQCFHYGWHDLGLRTGVRAARLSIFAAGILVL